MSLMRVGVVRLMHPHHVKPRKATGVIGSGKHASPYAAPNRAHQPYVGKHRAPNMPDPHPIAKPHQPMPLPSSGQHRKPKLAWDGGPSQPPRRKMTPTKGKRYK